MSAAYPCLWVAAGAVVMILFVLWWMQRPDAPSVNVKQGMQQELATFERERQLMRANLEQVERLAWKALDADLQLPAGVTDPNLKDGLRLRLLVQIVRLLRQASVMPDGPVPAPKPQPTEAAAA